MEEKMKYTIIKASLGVGEISPDITHVSVPVLKPIKTKNKFWVKGEPWIITSDKQYWPLTMEEQEERRVYAQSQPMFGPIESRWYELDIRRYLTFKKHVLSPLKGLFLPLKETLEDHIDFYQFGYSSVVACWIIGTYIHPVFTAYPYLLLNGPRGSGKSKLLEVLARTSFNAELVSNATVSSVFRLVQSNQPTLLIDEAEVLRQGKEHQEIKLLLNSGYKKGVCVSRTNKDTHEVEFFMIYSPKATASINQVDPVLRSRGIEVNMIKTSNKEKGNRRVTDNSGDWWKLRDGLYRYLLDYSLEVQKIYETSEEINQLECRNNELWSPLLSIAYHIDKSIFEDIKKIALASSMEEDVVLDDWRTALLRGLKKLSTTHAAHSIHEIKNSMSGLLEADELERVSSRWIGGALKGLGFKQAPRQASGRAYFIDPNQITDLMTRYQLIKNEHSEHSADVSGTDAFVEEVKNTLF